MIQRVVQSNFSLKLDDLVVAALNPGFQRKTAIFECEFFAVFCSFWLWGREFSDAVLIYADNNVTMVLGML